MARNTSVSLGEHFSAFVDEQVQTGRYGSVSEVIRYGLRLVEKEERQLEALRTALIEGENSGEPVEWDLEAFLARMRAERTG